MGNPGRRVGDPGDVCDENLAALLGPQFEPTRAWSQARASYAVMLNVLRSAEEPLVLKLVVPLISSAGLEIFPPDSADIESQVDHVQSPPILVVHAPLFQRSWRPDEEYRRPFATGALVDETGVALAQALYVVTRNEWELEDEGEYRRYLLFERVQ